MNNMRVPGKVTPFQTKLQQAVEMVIQVAHHFPGVGVTVSCGGGWFRIGTFKPLREELGNFWLLSRLRSDHTLSMPESSSKTSSEEVWRQIGIMRLKWQR
ncbi:MAG: hypothetical protein U5R49_24810 [Deltaproteobacteria bacterium]|nr:hypothetical protein [Deltaproteobacteria bacterium]